MDWKEEFVELLAKKEENAYQKALNLKRKEIPRFLYRYRSLGSQSNIDNVMSEIIDAKIYLASPKEFNDPFDGCSILRKENITGSDELKDAYIKFFSNLISENEIKSFMEKDNWFEVFNYRLASIISQKDGVTLDEALKNVDKMSWTAIEMINENLNKTIHSLARVACFSEGPYNLPMWNHYANSHEGVCLEYDLQDLNDTYILDRIFPVLYVSELPNGVDTYLNRNVNPRCLTEYLLIHKLNDWKYEKEWRLILSLFDWHFSEKDISPDEYDVGKVKDFIVPRKIYLGYRIGRACEELLRVLGDEFDIEVVKMERTEYGLSPEY